MSTTKRKASKAPRGRKAAAPRVASKPAAEPAKSEAPELKPITVGQTWLRERADWLDMNHILLDATDAVGQLHNAHVSALLDPKRYADSEFMRQASLADAAMYLANTLSALRMIRDTLRYTSEDLEDATKSDFAWQTEEARSKWST